MISAARSPLYRHLVTQFSIFNVEGWVVTAKDDFMNAILQNRENVNGTSKISWIGESITRAIGDFQNIQDTI